ncbi:CPBP family intramembrane glutamic endopeptidase [Massilia sp. 9096]|uniref:CPBP family intramembrane glutamic endopeptidase n=1 Tax=Massilia sp. 9096 TaxID=1500894 RepID=UPI00055B1112|nr:CPBP family intramembrane glutamic endopeptidase [Massilia sp. 9096]
MDPTAANAGFLLSYGPLAAAVLSLWAPALPLPALGRSGARCVPAWCLGLALACLAGLACGYLDWRALAAIGVYVVLARAARGATGAWLRPLLLVLTGAAAFLFALHRIPGFHNAVLASSVQVARGAPPFTLHANFDTTAAGIVLMGVFCRRIGSGRHWLTMLRRMWPVTLSTLVVVLGIGWGLGYVRPELKWTPVSAAFLAVNLLSTCVTEEAFFRGFLLERMARGWSRWRHGRLAALLASTLLFALAHAAGGAALVVLAGVAGLHYAAAYLVSRRIEGAILTHFALNAAHFLAFTYPVLAP